MEEDKYHENEPHSDENDDICVNDSDSNSEINRKKRVKKSHKEKNKHKSSKTKTIKRKYDGPRPSQHGMNMNVKDKFGEANPMYYQPPNRPMPQRMGEPFPHPAMPCQNMPFGGMAPPVAPMDNYKQEDVYHVLRDYYRNSFYPFSDDLLKDLVSQIDIYVQILVQTLLSTKDVNHQYQLYLLLYDFTKKKESILKPLKLPKFTIPWVNPDKEAGNPDGEPLKIQPQVSFYQSPILEYAYKIVKMIGK